MKQQLTSVFVFLLLALLVPGLAMAYDLRWPQEAHTPTAIEATLFAGVVVLFVMGLMSLLRSMFPGRNKHT